jgi:D-specific alpha-keto acid dehydrogenase
MARREPARAAVGVTIYGCDPGEAALFRELASRARVAPTITEAPVSEATAGLARGNRCVSVGHRTRVGAAELRALRRVGVAYLSTRSVGYDHIDVASAGSVGITVENVAYSPGSVADYTLMLILMLLRHARSTVRRVEAHDFGPGDARGRELRDLTVGVVGTGRIGTAVLDRLRGFGCRPLACDPHPRGPAEYVPLDELLRRSDLVTLHTPLTADTHHLLGRRRIETLRRGALVVNTGRGPLLDTEALVLALESGRLGGAALDVLEGEEGIFHAGRGSRPAESALLTRLLRLPNVIVSPHAAYSTDRALRDIVGATLANCAAFERRWRRWVA